MYELILNEKNRKNNQVEYDTIHNNIGVLAMINTERKLSNKIFDKIIFYKHLRLKIKAYAVYSCKMYIILILLFIYISFLMTRVVAPFTVYFNFDLTGLLVTA